MPNRPMPAPFVAYVVIPAGPIADALISILDMVPGPKVQSTTNDFDETKLWLTDSHVLQLTGLPDGAKFPITMIEPTPTVPLLPVDAPEPEPRPELTPLMHAADLARLARLANGLVKLSDDMGNPSDLLALARSAVATSAAYSAEHADRCLGCLPVREERRKAPRPPNPNTDTLTTRALSEYVNWHTL